MDKDEKPDEIVLSSIMTFRIAQAQNMLNAQAAHLLRTHSDMSLTEWRIISILRHVGGATMSVLAEEMHIDKGQLSRKLSAMIDKGLVATQSDPRDQRKQKLDLTDKAIAAHVAMAPVMKQRRDKLVAGISQEDLDIFLAVLSRIEKAATDRDIP